MEKVSEMDKFSKIGTSCYHFSRMGYTKSDHYNLDNDGIGRGMLPFKAWCELPEGTTHIGTNVTVEVEHCTGKGCYEKLLEYDIQADQLESLIESSPDCSQSLTFECLSSPIKVRIINLSMYIIL